MKLDVFKFVKESYLCFVRILSYVCYKVHVGQQEYRLEIKSVSFLRRKRKYIFLGPLTNINF